MKNKAILSLFACMLFVAASFTAHATGERVYIRQYQAGLGSKNDVYILEKGNVEKQEIESAYNKKEESLKSFGAILEKYFQQGYRIIGTTTGPPNLAYTEYILEKP